MKAEKLVFGRVRDQAYLCTAFNENCGWTQNHWCVYTVVVAFAMSSEAELNAEQREEEKSQTRRHVCEDSPVNAIFLVLVSKTLAITSGGQDCFQVLKK